MLPDCLRIGNFISIGSNSGEDDMKLGSNGDNVLKLQEQLIALQFLPEGSADGDFGMNTEIALKKFQLSNGLEGDGIVGALTLKKLYPAGLTVQVATDFSALDLTAPIIPGSPFTWADATKDGTRMPDDDDIYQGMIRIATEAQKVYDLLQVPMIVTSWYRTPGANVAAGGAADSRHLCGDAIDFYCDNLTGDEIYDQLDSWWTGGLGRYSQYPELIHIDARDYQARWSH